MTAPVQPIPIDLLPPAPRATDTVEEFDTQSFATLEAQVAMVPQINAAIAVTYQNTVAADERAQIADTKAGEASGSAAAAAADALRLASLDALWLGALAADPATGRNGARLVEGNAYVNTSTGYIRAYNGIAWVQGLGAVAGVKSLAGQMGDLALKTVAGQPLLGVGDIGFVNSYGAGEMYTGIHPPSQGVWLKTGELYLKSQYPELAAVLPASRVPLTWAPVSIAEFPALGILTGPVANFNQTVVAAPLQGAANATTTPIKFSRDFGVTWEDATLPAGFRTTIVLAVDKATGTFYFAGYDSVTATSLKLVSTQDFNTWVVKTAASAGGFSQVNGLHSIAAGGGVVMLQEANMTGRYVTTTDDGVSWAGGAMPGAAARWGCAHTGGQKFVAVAEAVNRAATFVQGSGWTARAAVASFPASGYLDSDGLTVAASSTAGAHMESTDGGATWAAVTQGVNFAGKVAISGSTRAFSRTTANLPFYGAVYDPISARPPVAGAIPQLSDSAAHYGTVIGHDGNFLFFSLATGSSTITRVVRIDSFGYDRSTHFYVPRATPAPGFDQWVRARDYA